MARIRSRKFRMRRSSSLVSAPQGSSHALAGDANRTAEASGYGYMRNMTAAIKRYFRRSKRNLPSSSANIGTPSGAQQHAEPPQVVPADDSQVLARQEEPAPDPASAAADVDAARRAFDAIKPVSSTGQVAVKFVAQADTRVINAQSLSDTYLKPLKVFNTAVTGFAEVHPYVRMALSILTFAAQLIITQANIDNAVLALVEKLGYVYTFLLEKDTIENMKSMKENLGKIARVVNDCAAFIKNYSKTTNFWKRLGKNVVSETQTAIDDYSQALDGLMQQYRDHTIRDIRIYMHRVLDELNLEGMSYAGGASLNTMKKCLDDTRMEILQDIIDWVNDPDPDAPRILWLHGQAGRGKSAIAHTIAAWTKDVGRLGSCFCFARDKWAERREEKMLSTIARDLAGWDPVFRKALARVLEEDHTLKTTPDVLQQWKKLILEPVSEVASVIVGNVAVVIDALDESESVSSRRPILSLLISEEAANLPSNFRILLTSRPLPDIECVLSSGRHVRVTCLDEVPWDLAYRDICIFVSKELAALEDIGQEEVERIAHRSSGLFEWARLACEFIKPYKPGLTAKEQFTDLIALPSDDAKVLLDTMYTTFLGSLGLRSDRSLRRFRSVMRQIVTAFVPLPMATLNHMRGLFPDEDDHYDIAIVLQFMAPMLGGIIDNTSPVRPLHASFYDFLTDHSRSGVYFINTSDSTNPAYARASLQVLCSELQFNICGLESSYFGNHQVTDLQERIKKNISCHLSYSCQFWAKHLERTKFDSSLARLVKAVVGSERFLFWLETLSLLNALGGADESLLCAARWLENQRNYDDAKAYATDGAKFIQYFASVITHSVPHIYLSAMPFTPSDSVLAQLLMPKFAHLVDIVQGGSKTWPAAQLGLVGHTGSVTSVAFSSDGSSIVSGSYDSTVRIWDAKSGVQVCDPLEGHTAAVTSVVFSHNGDRVVSGSYDETVRVWDARSGLQIGSPLEGHTDCVSSVALSPDGDRIVSGSYDTTVRVWDAKNGIQIGNSLVGHTHWVSSVAFSPNGDRIVSGSWDNTLRAWDAKSGIQIGNSFEGHTHWVSSVAFSPDGDRIASGSYDNTVRIWDAKSRKQIGSPLVGHADSVSSVAFSLDGNRIISGSYDKTMRVWDAKSGAQIGSPLEGHSRAVISVAFSPDGDRIASGLWDNTVRVQDATSGLQIDSSIGGHTHWVSSVAFLSDGSRIASGSYDKTVRVWDAKSGLQIGNPLVGHTDRVSSVAFSIDGDRIVSGSYDNTVRVWDVKAGMQIGNSLEGHAHWVSSVGFSPNGDRIVSGSWDTTVRVWDAKSGVQIGNHLEGHTRIVSSVAFSPDGDRVVSGSWDQTVRVWDPKSGVQIGNPLVGHTDLVSSVAFSFNGAKIVSGSRDHTVRIWDAKSGVQIGNPLEGHTRVVTSAVFSPDGDRIASGSGDKSIRVWDAKTGLQIGSPLVGHTDSTSSVAFSPDGDKIVSGSYDKTIRIWNVRSGAQIGSPLEGQSRAVNSDALSPDGNQIILPCPVSFSSSPSHALHDIEQLLHGFPCEGLNEPVKLHDDGWIRGPNSRLLLWIPPSLQSPFYSMQTTMVIPRGCCELDLSKMVHGNKWQQCFNWVTQ